MINKNIVYPNGITTTFHIVKAIEFTNLPSTLLNIRVSSFSNQADYLIGKQPVWNDYLTVPWTAIGANIERSICSWLIADFTAGDGVVTSDRYGIFYGGSLIANYSTDPLIYAQDKQWQIIKAKRAEIIANVDIDQTQSAINTAISAAKDHAATLKTAIYAATDIPTVEAIVW
jgi:hypothetical protein